MVCLECNKIGGKERTNTKSALRSSKQSDQLTKPFHLLFLLLLLLLRFRLFVMKMLLLGKIVLLHCYYVFERDSYRHGLVGVLADVDHLISSKPSELLVIAIRIVSKYHERKDKRKLTCSFLHVNSPCA